MPIHRTAKKNNYTTVDNYVFQDKTLSCKAKGMMSFILTLPDNWVYTEMGLVACLKEGRNAVRAILKELEEHHYLVRKRNRKHDGKWGDITYDFYEKPIELMCAEKPMYENGMYENGMYENGMYENGTQINTNRTSTNITNTNLNNDVIKKEKYKKEKKSVESSVSTEPTLFSPTVKDTHNFDKPNLEADFEKLWQMYPCKQGKTKAYEKFVKAVKSGVEVSKIEDGLKRYNQYIKVHNVEREFIKHGSTWFNQRCWEDEYDLTPPKPKASVPEVKPPPKPYLYDDPMAGGRWVL